MRMKYVLIALQCCVMISLQAQIRPQRAVVHVAPEAMAMAHSVPIAQPAPFLAYAIVSVSELTGLRIRFSADGAEWGSWQPLQPDAHAEALPQRHTSELYFTQQEHRFFQINGQPTTLDVHFYSPDATPSPALSAISPRPRTDCGCAQPNYQNRTDWCPAGNCPPSSSPVVTSVTHLIVHHSAGTNIANDWAAVVRAIWNFHVNVNGWADVGYNWLIDPNGILYEGRGDGVLGAHFCGTNTGTMGVCLLGDFTDTTPAEAAQNSLIELLGWQVCDLMLDPIGTSFHNSSARQLPHISGHRDGCNTACPGAMFYPLLGAVRQRVADYIDNDCSFATATRQELVLDAFRVFPNPADEQLQVHWQTPLEGVFYLSVQDLLGTVVQQRAIDKRSDRAQETISTHALPKGIYTITLRHASGQVTTSFIKK